MVDVHFPEYSDLIYAKIGLYVINQFAIFQFAQAHRIKALNLESDEDAYSHLLFPVEFYVAVGSAYLGLCQQRDVVLDEELAQVYGAILRQSNAVVQPSESCHLHASLFGPSIASVQQEMRQMDQRELQVLLTTLRQQCQPFSLETARTLWDAVQEDDEIGQFDRILHGPLFDFDDDDNRCPIAITQSDVDRLLVRLNEANQKAEQLSAQSPRVL